MLKCCKSPLFGYQASMCCVNKFVFSVSLFLLALSLFQRFQKTLPETFTHLSAVFKSINARMKAEQLRVSKAQLKHQTFHEPNLIPRIELMRSSTF